MVSLRSWSLAGAVGAIFGGVTTGFTPRRPGSVCVVVVGARVDGGQEVIDLLLDAGQLTLQRRRRRLTPACHVRSYDSRMPSIDLFLVTCLLAPGMGSNQMGDWFIQEKNQKNDGHPVCNAPCKLFEGLWCPTR